jgi:hypothetical protein
LLKHLIKEPEAGKYVRLNFVPEYLKAKLKDPSLIRDMTTTR